MNTVVTRPDLLSILRRRKWHLIIPAVAVLAISTAIILLLPPVYRSSATILIEHAEIPEDFVRPTVTTAAEQRVHAIKQKITVSSDLAELITRLDLYPEERTKQPMSDITDRMREDIQLSPVTVRSANQSNFALGFTLSFDHRDPIVAQRVTNELVSRFLEQSLRERREQAIDTTQFLSGELIRLEEQMRNSEQRIAAFKAEHVGALPEDLTYNKQLIERNERDLTELTRQLVILEQRRTSLRGQLAQVQPHVATPLADGRTATTPEAQLRALEVEYAQLSGRYGPEHPDVRKLRRERDALKALVGRGASANLAREVETARQELLRAQQQYGANHPDVRNLSRQLAALERRSSPVNPNAAVADNPAYLQITSQLDGIEAEYRTLTTQRDVIREQLDRYRGLVVRMPEIEREYVALVRNYENTSSRYNDLKTKTMEAELAQTLEADRKAERFTLSEPPDLPTSPEKPPRMLLLILAVVMSIGSGIGTVAAAEALELRVYGARKIAALTGQMPLVAMPRIFTPAEMAHRRRALVGLGLLLICTTTAGIVAFNEYVMPLDVVQHIAQRKLGME